VKLSVFISIDRHGMSADAHDSTLAFGNIHFVQRIQVA
jgi:hypothetical protein